MVYSEPSPGRHYPHIHPTTRYHILADRYLCRNCHESSDLHFCRFFLSAWVHGLNFRMLWLLFQCTFNVFLSAFSRFIYIMPEKSVQDSNSRHNNSCRKVSSVLKPMCYMKFKMKWSMWNIQIIAEEALCYTLLICSPLWIKLSEYVLKGSLPSQFLSLHVPAFWWLKWVPCLCRPTT
jgi:hypothetical protein